MLNFLKYINKSYIITEDDKSLHERILSLEEKIKYLQEENMEINNLLYETLNSITGLDTRIDMLALEKYTPNNSFEENQ